jgi:hypothetical protein
VRNSLLEGQSFSITTARQATNHLNAGDLPLKQSSIRLRMDSCIARPATLSSECIAFGRVPVVTAGQARLVMEVTLAAELSAARNEPVSLGALVPGRAETDEAAI